MNAVSVLSNYVGLLQVAAFMGSWGLAMLTGLMFAKAGE